MAKIGRPTDAVKERYRKILEESGAYERFRKILKQTEKEENFLKAFEMAEDRASGKPKQGIDVNDVTEQRCDRERVESALRSIEDIISRIRLAETK